VHTVVLIVAIGLSGYASVNKGLPGVATLRLGAVNAQGLAFGQGGAAGQVELGRAGTIIKPIAIPADAPVQHSPTSYIVREGEDVYAIAKKFNITADELRWSNPDRLTRTDLVRQGDQLQVPPIQGVVVMIKATDTVQAIAAAYKVDPQAIIDFNYLRDPDHLTAGVPLVVPNGRGPQLWPRRATEDVPHLGPYANSKFVYGQCTWYVASRRYVPWTGDAWMWWANARAMGFPEGQVPEPGAILVTWEGFYGHVAYVEQVNLDGSFVVSEMNYQAWNVIDTRLIKSTKSLPVLGFIY
jgi:peptidoglycan DL-endopeptidase LytE